VSEYKQVIGGSIEDAEKKFPWLKEAVFSSAVIDIAGKYLIWEGGTWKSGLWEYGIWEDGRWKGGTWEGGIWKSGTWEDGLWKNGIWERGTWGNGIWKDGIWEYGTWECGTWENGIWERGTWEGGKACLIRCKWKVSIDKDKIIIGCESMTVKEWDEFFASDKVIETQRDTEAFNLIHRAYKIARYSVELDM